MTVEAHSHRKAMVFVREGDMFFFHNIFPETNLLNGKQKATGKPMAMDVYTNEC